MTSEQKDHPIVINVPQEYFDVMQELVKRNMFKNLSQLMQKAFDNLVWDLIEYNKLPKEDMENIKAEMLKGEEKCESQK